MTLTNRVVLVTGAGAGIGRAIAPAMAKAGAKVACADIDASAAQTAAEAISSSGGEALAVAADVGDMKQIDRMFCEINAICPGVTRTPLLERSMARRAAAWNVSVEEAQRTVVQSIPIRRLNEPEDIAALAVFLASPAARNVTGQAWNVDGGIITS